MDHSQGAEFSLFIRSPSRASPLPHWTESRDKNAVNCGSGLAREDGSPVNIALGILHFNLIQLMIKAFQPCGPRIDQHFEIPIDHRAIR